MKIFQKKTCLNCFYCSKKWGAPSGGGPFILSLEEREREQAKVGDYRFLEIGERLECHRGQWSEAVSGVNKTELRKALPTKSCHNFYRFEGHVGQVFSGAIENQGAQEQKKRDLINILIFISVAIAAIISIWKVFHAN